MPETPLEWVVYLSRRLSRRWNEIRKFDDYYEGRQPNVLESPEFRSAFGSMLDGYVDNWCRIVVDAPEERLNVEGFRFGDDGPADMDAWDIWQANQLDAESQIAHTEALVNGVAYTLTWPDETSPVGVRVTVEHPSQMIVEYAAGDRRRRVAALKKWTGDDGDVWATLYLPDAIHKFRAAPSVLGGDSAWEVRDKTIPNPLGVVPVVPLVNRPRLLAADGQSELVEVIPNQDAVNKLAKDMLVASEFGAFMQRWATGVQIPRDPETGQPIEGFAPSVKRFWHSENPEAKFGSLPATDLNNFVIAIENRIQAIASQTRTPPHYLNASADRLSGESIKAAETGLVAKTKRKMRHFGEAWEETIRLAFLARDDTRRSQVITAETIWRDPESRTEAEHVDAVGKKRKLLDVPRRQAWEDAGYSPTQIERMEGMLAREALLDQAVDLSDLAV